MVIYQYRLRIIKSQKTLILGVKYKNVIAALPTHPVTPITYFIYPSVA